MSDASFSLPRSLARLRDPRVWGQILLILAALPLSVIAVQIFMRDASSFYTFSPEGYGRYWSYAVTMFAHIFGGTLALFLGPLQFVTPFRRRFPVAHRRVGYAYFFGVTIGAASAFHMVFDVELTRTVGFAVGLFCLAVCWVLTAVLAYRAVTRRRFALHQQFMAQNYALTLSFVVTRWLFDLDIAFIQNMGPMRYITMGWVGWVMPLFLVGAAFQYRQIIGAKAG